MFETAIPVIQVSASVAAEEFYCPGMGFRLLSSWRPDETKSDPRYMTLARDGARLHVHSFQGGMVGASAAYVFVDDVDSLYAELLSNGVPVSGPPLDQSWETREIAVRDADRNVVTLGRSVNLRLTHYRISLSLAGGGGMFGRSQVVRAICRSLADIAFGPRARVAVTGLLPIGDPVSCARGGFRLSGSGALAPSP